MPRRSKVAQREKICWTGFFYKVKASEQNFINGFLLRNLCAVTKSNFNIIITDFQKPIIS